MYEYKSNKYKLKYQNITNLVGGYKDCNIAIANNHLDGAYIKNNVNLVPFEKSIFHPIRSHPVCSYSIWNKQHTQLYIPTPPNYTDKIFKYLNYRIRAYQIFYNPTGVLIDEIGKQEETKHDFLLWSNKHQKWYIFDTFPKDDNTLEKLGKDMNMEILIDSNPEPRVLVPDMRVDLLMYIVPPLTKFLVIKNIIKPLIKEKFNISDDISYLLDEAYSTRYVLRNIQFNTAAPGYIKELEELEELYRV